MSIEIGGVEVYSLEEVSKRLNVEPDALKRCMRRGELVARKIGDQWFVTSQNLLAFLQTPSTPAKRGARTRATDEPQVLPVTAPTLALEPTPLIGPAVPAAEAAPTPAVAEVPVEESLPTPVLEEEIISAAPRAGLKDREPETSVKIAKPETVFPHQLPPGIPDEPVQAAPARPVSAEKATEPIMTAVKVQPPSHAEPLFVSASETPVPTLSERSEPKSPGVLESEKATDLSVPTIPLPSHLSPPPRGESPTAPTLIVGAPARDEEKPPPPSSGDALAALFDLPFLSPDEPAMSALHAPTPPAGPSFGPEDKHALAIEATRRRAMARTGTAEDAPAPGGKRTLLDSEEMPSVSVDLPGAAMPPETRPVVKTVAPPRPTAPGARLSDIPNMFGPDSPTVLLTPEQVVADAERTKRVLHEVMEQGRIAQRARDEVVATVRKLPLEEQSFALAGPIGEQLVKLDKLIEDGMRAQKELGLTTPPSAPNVVTAVHRAPAAIPKMEESKWLPVGQQAAADPMPLIAPQSDAVIPVAPPSVSKRPASRVGPVGGETWQEVGLPSGSAAAGGRQDTGGIVRLTLSLSDEEKRVLSDHRIAEETAVQEIMRRYQPTDERGWVDAKGRYFQPLKGKGGVRA
ncbi:MAG: helix-turn-helix domain-containing protein [Planctomycetota bacterium]